MNKQITRDKLSEYLVRVFPKMWVKDSEEFDGSCDAIISGEGSEVIEGYALFNRNDHKEILYTLGIWKPLVAILDEYGWYAEWVDGGTIRIGRV